MLLKEDPERYRFDGRGAIATVTDESDGQGRPYPAVTIAARGTSAPEGAAFALTVSREGTSGNLPVDLAVSETGSRLGV